VHVTPSSAYLAVNRSTEHSLDQANSARSAPAFEWRVIFEDVADAFIYLAHAHRIRVPTQSSLRCVPEEKKQKPDEDLIVERHGSKRGATL
jgi:hypothetical protein